MTDGDGDVSFERGPGAPVPRPRGLSVANGPNAAIGKSRPLRHPGKADACAVCDAVQAVRRIDIPKPADKAVAAFMKGR